MDDVNEVGVADQAPDRNPRLLIRVGRGRTGGSTMLDLIVQRARYQGRRVKPLDGDWRSRTLTERYPRIVDGRPVADAATAPISGELPDIKAWLSGELNQMVADRISRVLDLSGGDRVMQEYVRELRLGEFSRDLGVDVVLLVLVGPEMEDFQHAYQVLKAEGIPTDRVVLVFNEGVVGAGQTVSGAFEKIMDSPEYKKFLDDRARLIFMQRLPCMRQLQERGLRFYDVIAAKPSALSGGKIPATLYYMVKVWVDHFERELAQSKITEWMP